MAAELPVQSSVHKGGDDYPAGVPSKFDPDGNVQPFPGNTIIAHLSTDSPIYPYLQSLYEKLQTFNLRHLYALLPPASWHMTIFEGVCDQVRDQPGHWPSDLPNDAPLEECTALFEKKLEPFRLPFSPPYHMKVDGLEPLTVGIGVHVEPRDPQENERLRGLRDRLAETLKLRFEQHDSYGLHISLAYFLRKLTKEQENEMRALLEGELEDMPKQFVLGAPEFCRFDDMCEFKRISFLQSLNA
jgi:hypothetical protein